MTQPDSSGGNTYDLGASEYLVYRVLMERREQDNQETGRTKFFKLSCLTDRRLIEKEGVNIGFPRHWYKYGEVVEEHSINPAVIFAPSANHQEGQAYYPANQVSEADFSLEEDLKNAIFRTANSVVQEHGTKNRKQLEQLQYREYAHDEFIRTYSDLRWHLSAESQAHEEGLKSLDHFSSELSQTEELLNEMFRTYPEEEYEEVYHYFLTWEDTMRMLVEENAHPGRQLAFLEFFIEKLSQITLRFLYRQNIPERRLESWLEEKPKHIEELDTRLESVREGLIEERPTSEIFYELSDSYDQVILTESHQ
ncbi:uncharacterized protein HHUB_4282 (plasmid) [Halobacterium hubeiense]|uniref:Uncharacterized protein n=2 Tax=Halobacterium hubeiense TaxID=1407499 RepID=A0A0U5H652_9EURY|nr:hypothetical protein [Halobacterium hubeiense]CQH64115.1 uncharacterized protein HHUB_4282 [Halobacterium hubeiense]